MNELHNLIVNISYANPAKRLCMVLLNFAIFV